MEKRFHKDKLEEYFRKSLAGLGETPSTEAWDVPSDKVWENIESSIPTVGLSPREAAINKLRWFLALIALLLLFISYQLYTYHKKLDAIASQVRENTAVVEALQRERNAEEAAATKLGFRKKKGEANAMPLVEDVEKISAEKLNSAGTGEGFDGTVNRRKKKAGIVPQLSVQGMLNDFPEKNSIQKNVASDRRHSEVANSFKPQNQPVIAGFGKNKGKSNSKNWNNQATKVLGEGMTPNAIAENPNGKDFQNLSHLNQIAPSAAMAPLELKTIFLVPNKPPLGNRSIPDYGISAEKKENIHPERLSLGVYFSPAYSYRSLTSKVSGATQSFDEEASGKLSYNLGIQLGYDLTRRWTLLSGLNYHNLNQTSLHRIGLRYTRVGGSIEGGNFVNTYDAELKTSLGDAKVEIRIADGTPNAAIPEGRPIPILLRARQHLEYLGIPLLAEFRLWGNKFAFTIKGGFVGNFLVQRGLEITAVTPLSDRLIHRRTDIKSERILRQLKDFTLDVQLGVGLYFGLFKNVQLFFEPTYQRNLRPVFENQRFKTNTFTWAINSGLRFHF